MSADQNREWTPEDRRVIDALADMLREAKSKQVDPLSKWYVDIPWRDFSKRSPRRVTSRWVKWKHNRCR